MKNKRNTGGKPAQPESKTGFYILLGGGVLFVLAILYAVGAFSWMSSDGNAQRDMREDTASFQPKEKWMQRAYAIDKLFHEVYTAGWEGANGAIGDAHLFALTADSALLRFHTQTHPMRDLFNGTWVDDRAWAALADKATPVDLITADTL